MDDSADADALRDVPARPVRAGHRRRCRIGVDRDGMGCAVAVEDVGTCAIVEERQAAGDVPARPIRTALEFGGYWSEREGVNAAVAVQDIAAGAVREDGTGAGNVP